MIVLQKSVLELGGAVRQLDQNFTEDVGNLEERMRSSLTEALDDAVGRAVRQVTGALETPARATAEQQAELRVRFHIIRSARIENVGKYQSCMVSKLRIIWKQTVALAVDARLRSVAFVGAVS